MSYAQYPNAFCGTGTNVDPISGLPVQPKTQQLSAQDDVSQLVSSIVTEQGTQSILQANGLKAHSVTWEDTARSKGSCWGPNISDMTLVVKDGSRLMPVVRKPNFSDVTDDVPIETFKLLVGNEIDSKERKVVGLRDYLRNISQYTDNTHEFDLQLPRDDVVLTSSQCCVLPVRKGTKTEFALQLFNYQSYDEDPAVLVILVTKDGVSAQVLERSNTKLYFNDKGTARWFSAERLQDMRERKTGQKQKKVDSFKEMKEDEKMENVLMMIQVPLKQKERIRSRGIQLGGCDGFAAAACFSMNESCSMPVYRSVNLKSRGRVKGHGMDMGMLGLGSSEGKYTGTKDLVLARDDRFPIRCTFQYYRVTDQNFVSEHDIRDIAEQIGQATKIALATGSLVFSDPVPSKKVVQDEEDKRAEPMDTDDTEPVPKKPRATEPTLDQPKASDNPFGKLEERDYLKQVQTTASSAWSQERMSGFM